jgi:hypothetical protein
MSTNLLITAIWLVVTGPSRLEVHLQYTVPYAPPAPYTYWQAFVDGRCACDPGNTNWTYSQMVNQIAHVGTNEAILAISPQYGACPGGAEFFQIYVKAGK